jgi:hypothetical protein
MGMTLSPTEMELYRATDEVLYYLWDPIGISAIPDARDEYRGYLPHVFGMLRANATQTEIAAYLSEITSARMGLSAVPERDTQVAKILVSWRDVIADNGNQQSDQLFLAK